MHIVMKHEKEYVVFDRMPGSKPGTVPAERRDFNMRGVKGSPWGNPDEWVEYVKDIKEKFNLVIDGIALSDPIDHPEGLELIEF